jgi:spoIIIJ-associated protein
MDRVASIDFAQKYLEDLLSFFGLNTSVTARCEEGEEVIELVIPSTHLNGFLIGQRGETLRSLQFLLSMALKNKEVQASHGQWRTNGVKANEPCRPPHRPSRSC